MKKKEIISYVLEKIAQEKREAEKSFEITRQAAVDAPGAMQSHSDTTKSQMGWLADDIQRSMREKEVAIELLRSLQLPEAHPNCLKVNIGSIIEVLNEKDERKWFFILPAGGGIAILDQSRTIMTITAQTPLALGLLGKKQGDECKIQIAEREQSFVLCRIE